MARPVGFLAVGMVCTQSLCACRDFEKEASQKQREARPALEKVKSAEETVEAVEDQVRRAEEFANSNDEELKAVMEQLRSAPLPFNCICCFSGHLFSICSLPC